MEPQYAMAISTSGVLSKYIYTESLPHAGTSYACCHTALKKCGAVVEHEIDVVTELSC